MIDPLLAQAIPWLLPLVPQLVAGGQDGSLVNLLLATYLRDRGNGHAPEPPAA